MEQILQKLSNDLITVLKIGKIYEAVGIYLQSDEDE
jgi:hypothetical protein